MSLFGYMLHGVYNDVAVLNPDAMGVYTVVCAFVRSPRRGVVQLGGVCGGKDSVQFPDGKRLS